MVHVMKHHACLLTFHDAALRLRGTRIISTPSSKGALAVVQHSYIHRALVLLWLSFVAENISAPSQNTDRQTPCRSLTLLIYCEVTVLTDLH